MANGTINNPYAIMENTEVHSVAVTYSGISTTCYVYRNDRTCELKIEVGNGTAFSSATGNDTIGTLPSDCIPRHVVVMPATIRTDGNWTSATYYHATLVINTDGTIQIRGTASQLKQCKYFIGEATYIRQL